MVANEQIWEERKLEYIQDNFEIQIEEIKEEPLPVVEPKRQKKPRDQEAYEEDNLKIRKFYELKCYKCVPVTGLQFETFSGFKAHFRETHPEASPFLVCCNIKLTKRYSLLEHMKHHTSSEDLMCPICDKVYSKRDILNFHIKQMHGSDQDRPFKCEMCQKRYVKLENLRTHMRIHLSKEDKAKLKVHECKECNVKFSSIYNLKNHEKYKHMGIMPFFCAGCAKHYKSRLDYEVHRRNVHGDEGGPQRVHCHLCSKLFSHEKSLKIHIRDTHNEQPGPHVCVECGHRTKSRQALRSHVRMKHEERRFACSFCEKKFQMARQLAEHVTTHVGGALYNCNFCERTFNSNSNMYKHLKALHAESWNKEKKIRAMNPHPLSRKGAIELVE